MKKQLKNIILSAAILLVLLVGLQVVTSFSATYVTPQSGQINLSEVDLSSKLAEIKTEGWEFYPEQFYGPDDFSENAPAPGPYTGEKKRFDYGTYRLVVMLKPGKTYTMTGHSFNFSQRVYIDGKLADEIGVPGETLEETVPHTKTYTYTFTPLGETTELVFQAAGFQHREGAVNAAIRLGETAVVSRWQALEFIRTSILVGGLFTVFLYYLGMFIFFPKRRYFLFLALTGFMTAMRILLTGEKHMMEIFPDFNWFAAIRMEYICNILFTIFLLLYFVKLYPKLLHKAFTAAVIALIGIYGLLVLFCDTKTFSTILPWYTVVWVAASAVTLIKMALLLRRKDIHTVLIFLGLMVFALTAGFDEIAYLLLHNRIYDTIIIGVLTCIFMNMIALALNLSEIEGELSEAKIRQRETDETNRFLDRLSQMKTRFIANTSHEMKTPLTVMSANAQLSKVLINTGADKEEIFQYLDTISRESERLARMMEGMLALGSRQEEQEQLGPVELSSLLQNSVTIYRAIAESKGNRLILEMPEQLPVVNGDADALSQVILNLLSNANRYTKNGRITIEVKQTAHMLTVSVRDTGEGISPELLPYIFERRVKEGESSGAGLGLAISRSIVERHGGTIEMESSLGIGTAVTFSLPVSEKEVVDE